MKIIWAYKKNYNSFFKVKRVIWWMEKGRKINL